MLVLLLASDWISSLHLMDLVSDDAKVAGDTGDMLHQVAHGILRQRRVQRLWMVLMVFDGLRNGIG